MTILSRQSRPMIVNETGGVGAVIGININFVQNMLTETKDCSGEIKDQFHGVTDTILGTLGAGWGTKDSIKEVDEIIASFNKCAEQIDVEFDNLIKTIKLTAQKISQKTKNVDTLVANFSYNREEWFKYTNYQKETLENGYVGIIPSIIDEIPQYSDELKNNMRTYFKMYREKMNTLGRRAFADQNNIIANKINEYILRIENTIMKTVNEAIDLIKAKTKYAKQFQIDALGQYSEINY